MTNLVIILVVVQLLPVTLSAYFIADLLKDHHKTDFFDSGIGNASITAFAISCLTFAWWVYVIYTPSSPVWMSPWSKLLCIFTAAVGSFITMSYALLPKADQFAWVFVVIPLVLVYAAIVIEKRVKKLKILGRATGKTTLCGYMTDALVTVLPLWVFVIAFSFVTKERLFVILDDEGSVETYFETMDIIALILALLLILGYDKTATMLHNYYQESLIDSFYPKDTGAKNMLYVSF